MRLLFVHGRAQEGRTSQAIRDEWVAALNAGLQKAGRPKLSIVPDVPFYGDLLIDLTRSFAEAMPADMRELGRDDDFRRFLEQFAVEVNNKAPVAPEAVQRAFPSAAAAELAGADVEDFKERGPQNWWWVQAIIRAIDERFPGVSADAISLILRDVYVYLTDARVQSAISNKVAALLTPEPTVVVGHSLGSVVAYNILSKSPTARVLRYVTVGSPLGIHAVRERLGGPPAIPAAVGNWYNARDRRDVVALNPLLDPFFKTKPDISNNDDVNNTSDNRHHISHYLDDPAVASKIADALVA